MKILISILMASLLAACVPSSGVVIEGDAQRDSNSFSIGKRAGVIVKLSRKGNNILSYEGQMLLGGASKKTVGDPAVTYIVPNTWEFSISDRDAVAAKEAEQALISGTRVIAVYQQLKTQSDQWADTDYRLKAVLKVGAEGNLEYLNGEPYTEDAQGLPLRGASRSQ